MNTPSAATTNTTTAIAPVKNHYVILDGLRGVASLMVLAAAKAEAGEFKEASQYIRQAIDAIPVDLAHRKEVLRGYEATITSGKPLSIKVRSVARRNFFLF